MVLSTKFYKWLKDQRILHFTRANCGEDALYLNQIVLYISREDGEMHLQGVCISYYESHRTHTHREWSEARRGHPSRDLGPMVKPMRRAVRRALLCEFPVVVSKGGHYSRTSLGPCLLLYLDPCRTSPTCLAHTASSPL